MNPQSAAAAASPAVVIDLIEAFRRSKTMFTAVSLGIFDQLYGRPADAGTLAASLSANQDALERLLDGCVALGLLAKADGVYSSTPSSDTYLRRESPQTLAGYILYSDRALYPMWGNLESAIREGTNRWVQTFGGSGSLFDHHFSTEDAKRTFVAGMHGWGQISSPAVVAAFDLSRFRSLVDLGGASGHLVLAALDRYPHMGGAVFDLPSVEPVAREYLGNRAAVFSGDFFNDPLPPADLYSLGRILHDWADDKCVHLLRRIYAALPPGGGVLIADKLLAEDKTGPLPALMQSLSMLVCTEGKERTAPEFTHLLQQAGFTDIQAKVTGAPLDAMLAVK